MKVKSSAKAGAIAIKHNRQVRGGLRVKSKIKAGGISLNHNQTVNG